MNAEVLNKWMQDHGDKTRCIEYPIDENSVVFDVGGYKGNWAASIVEKYNSHVTIFEPILEFFNTCEERFKSKPKVNVLNYGLSDKDSTETIFVEFDSSSLYITGKNEETIVLRDVASVITSPVDLLSINVEGSEYLLLLRMLDSGVVKLCRNIQVQFHDFYPNGENLRNEIRERLKETHVESYCYPFVWESWKLSV
jgi:FkbM family methyltransferase